MNRYLIVIEPTPSGYSAYAPDLPGCISTGQTIDDIKRNMTEAIEFHLEGMRAGGLHIPEPSTEAAYVQLREGIVQS